MGESDRCMRGHLGAACNDNQCESLQGLDVKGGGWRWCLQRINSAEWTYWY